MAEFKEIQKFSHWWVWVILVGVVCVWAYLIYQQLYLGEPVGNNPMSDRGVMVSALLPPALVLLFLFLSLNTTLDASGIHIRYFPLWSTHIPWNEVEKAELIQYSFVGYGIRFSFKYGTVYNVKGNTGLHITKTNGRKILLGTQRPDDLKKALTRYS